MASTYRLGWVGPALVGVIVAAVMPLAQAAAQDITFNRSIRPILSEHCYTCHGPDSAKRKAHLRLDQREALYDPLPDDGDLRAFVPGHPEKSEAYRRITAIGSDDVMPPSKAHSSLSASEKEMVRKWIEQGAKWQQYWAFIAPVRPTPPAVKDAAWPRNDIDRFVLARLESLGLHPSPEADKETLIRRVSLDLTGIPPTPAEVDAFIADQSPDAYDKVVDRLLASPRYGEQMAIKWLDYARYADSHGYQSDPERFMWRWRDWVINAYNKNMPFDQFTIEQLAGDLLPHPTADQRIATGFNRNHRINDEGGIIAEEWRVEGVIDRASTTSEVWLGLTMGCCRCHDHKFDPITQKEFYSFCGFFNSVNEVGIGDTGATDRGANVPPVLKLPNPEQKLKLRALTARIDAGKAQLKELDGKLTDARHKWEEAGAARIDPWALVARFSLDGKVEGEDAHGNALAASVENAKNPKWTKGNFGKALQVDGKDGVIDAGSAVSFDHKDAFSYGCWARPQGDGTLLSKMDDAPGYRGFDVRLEKGAVEVHLVHHWPDNAITVITNKHFPNNKWLSVLVTYDGSDKAEGVKIYVNGAAQRVRKEKDSLHDAFTTKTPLLIGSRVKSSTFKGAIEEVVFINRVVTVEEARQLAQRPSVQKILDLAADQRSGEQKKTLENYFQMLSPDFARMNSELAANQKSFDELEKQVPDTMVMEDLPKPRDNFVLIRGEYDHHGEKVPTGVPAVLPPMPKGAPMNRLGLAEWLVDPSNPLTSRVQVNRLWEKFFGTGIVKTSENMGTQADLPSNPELLDWLATELLRDHWDLKAFQKLIVTSAAYRQSSNVTPELLERDPDNQLIARGPRFRLCAETIRDQALAASGLLVEKIGGPSVRPYEPANLWNGNRFGNLAQYNQDKGDGLYRRSLYTFLKRTATPPNLTDFDMPSREYCVIKRSRTDTPLQALDMMNDPQYVEAARVLAEHMIADGGSTPIDRIIYGFRRVTCRKPTDKEAKILLGGLQKQLARYQADPELAKKLVSIGDTPHDPAMNVSELAAYTMTSSVMLNLDETINKQ